MPFLSSLIVETRTPIISNISTAPINIPSCFNDWYIHCQMYLYIIPIHSFQSLARLSLFWKFMPLFPTTPSTHRVHLILSLFLSLAPFISAMYIIFFRSFSPCVKIVLELSGPFAKKKKKPYCSYMVLLYLYYQHNSWRFPLDTPL